MTQQDIVNTVDPIARLYGVPTGVWEAVVNVESGFNPNQIGDNGTSYGLFQLHAGGQLGNLTPSQAFDPATNAKVAMPSIASAWRQLKGGNPNSLAFWQQFASISGHPAENGNIYDPAVQDEATKLYNAYRAESGANVPSQAPFPMNVTLASSTGGSSTGIGAWLGSAGAKVGLFALGILLLIIGLLALASKPLSQAGKVALE